jgi:hypothetical protein
VAGIDRFECITVAVKDQDEALHWFTELGFEKRRIWTPIKPTRKTQSSWRSKWVLRNEERPLDFYIAKFGNKNGRVEVYTE